MYALELRSLNIGHHLIDMECTLGKFKYFECMLLTDNTYQSIMHQKGRIKGQSDVEGYRYRPHARIFDCHSGTLRHSYTNFCLISNYRSGK